MKSLYQVHGRRRHKNTIIFKDLPLRLESVKALKDAVGPIARRASLSASVFFRYDETTRVFEGMPDRALRILSFQQEMLGAAKAVSAAIEEIDEPVSHEFVLTRQDCRISPLQPYSNGWWCSKSLILFRYLQFLAGTAFGRWESRGQVEAFSSPQETNDSVFTALPACPPAMSHEPVDLIPEYSQGIAPQSLHTVGDTDNLSSAVQRLLPKPGEDAQHMGASLGDTEDSACADNISSFITSLLGFKGIAEYLSRPQGFFKDHLECYSFNKRQAPIYWQLSCGSYTFSVWLYYHRFSSDTLYQALRLLEARVQRFERDQFEFESQESLSGNAVNRLQEVQILLADLRLLTSELDLVAPLWNPNLNDGVIINHAILWRITPYTPWQKKCKECWDKLVKGDYDWAHLAFHLWPERVIRKCTTDRSLAIAHGLDHRLWQETNNGNWLPRQVSEADLQALIIEHTKSSVQSALEQFLATPPPVAAARVRAPRAARSTATGTTRRSRGADTPVDAEASRQALFVLNAAPAEGLSRNALADLLGVEASSLTAVIKQLKETGQIEQLGAARGAKYRLTEQGRSVVESQAGEDQEA